MLIYRSIVLALVAAGAISIAGAVRGEERELEYPALGASLGEGWDSQKVKGLKSYCIEFAEAYAQKGQRILSEITEINDKSQLDQALGVSADFSVKGMGWNASAKAEYSKSIAVNSAFSSFAVLARVNNGYITVAPPILVGSSASYREFNSAVTGEGGNTPQARKTNSVGGSSSSGFQARTTSPEIGSQMGAGPGAGPGADYQSAIPLNAPRPPKNALRPNTILKLVGAPTDRPPLDQATPSDAVKLIKTDKNLDPNTIGKKLDNAPSMAKFKSARTLKDTDKALTLAALNGGFVRSKSGRTVPPKVNNNNGDQNGNPSNNLEPAPTPAQRIMSNSAGFNSGAPKMGMPTSSGPMMARAVDEEEDHRYIKLTPANETLAASNLPAFRRKCGDFFVMAIKEGAEISGFVSITTSSREEQTKISAEVSGSGFGFSGTGKFNDRMKQAEQNSQLILKYAQSGGKDTKVATDREQMIKNVQDLTKFASSAPYSYQIVIASYDELYNWPQENDYHVPLGPFKELAREYGKWATLRDDIDTIINNPNNYLIDRTGDTMEKLDQIRTMAASKVQTILDQAKKCTDANPTSSGGQLQNGCTMPTGVEESDLPYRVKLPLPLATPSLPIELTYSASQLKTQVVDFWAKRLNERRCKFDPNDTKYCASAYSISNFASPNNSTVPAVRDKALVLVNPAGLRCLTAQYRNPLWVAETDNCKTTGDKIEVNNSQKFYYNPDKKDFYMAYQVNGKTMCLDVDNNGLTAGTRVQFYSCNSYAAQVFAVEPAEVNDPTKPMARIRGQSSKLCVDVSGGNVGSGASLHLWPCEKGNEAQQWRIFAAP